MEAPWVTPGKAQLDSAVGPLECRHVDLGGVPRGAVALVCGEVDRDGFLNGAMNRLAEQGFEVTAVVIPPQGLPVRQAGTRDQELAGVAEAAVNRLLERGWLYEQIGVVGLGSPAAESALAAAIHLPIGASVSVAGDWLSDEPSVFDTALSSPQVVRCPWLGLFGSKDPTTQVTIRDTLADSLGQHSPVFTEVVLYPRVHGPFYRDSPDGAGHAEAFEAWQRTVEWLNLRVVPRPTALAERWRQLQVGPTPTSTSTK
jgi:carboxymethylenebutenolidase